MKLHLHILAMGCCLLANCAHLNGNFQTVEPGRMYRSGQLHADAFARRMDEFGIRTVITLRAADPNAKWYHAEVAACDARGADFHALGWSMEQLPEPPSLVRYLDLLETAQGPVLVHCQGGVHRAAIASAAYVLHRGGTIADARAQIGPGFRDAPIGRLLNLYEASDGVPFGVWARDEYPALYALETTNLRNPAE